MEKRTTSSRVGQPLPLRAICAATHQEVGPLPFDFQGHHSDVFDLHLSEFAFEPGDGSAELW